MKSYVNSATGRRVPDPDPPPDSFFSDGRRPTNFVTKKLLHHTDRYVHYRKHPGSAPDDSSLSTNPTQIETSYNLPTEGNHLLSDQLYPQNTFGQTSLSKFLTLTSICSRVAEHLSLIIANLNQKEHDACELNFALIGLTLARECHGDM